MSEKQITNPNQALDTGPLTPVDYAAIAAEIHKALDTVDALMPKFTAVQHTAAASVARGRRVTLELLTKATSAAEENPSLQGIFDVNEANDLLAYHLAFRPILDRMTAGAKGLKFSLTARLVSASKSVLKIYAVAKAVAKRTPDTAELASHVANMREEIPQARRGRNRAPTPSSPAPSAPVEKST